MSDYIVGNVSNLIIQYGQKSNAVATVTAYSEEFELIYDNANILQMAYDLDFAVGKQLDIIGKIVGISRNVPFSIPKNGAIATAKSIATITVILPVMTKFFSSAFLLNTFL